MIVGSFVLRLNDRTGQRGEMSSGVQSNRLRLLSIRTRGGTSRGDQEGKSQTFTLRLPDLVKSREGVARRRGEQRKRG